MLAVAIAERTAAEAQLAAAERRLAEGAKAAATRAGRVARLREQVGAADSRSVAAQEEMDRLEVSAAEARDRAAPRPGRVRAGAGAGRRAGRRP